MAVRPSAKFREKNQGWQSDYIPLLDNQTNKHYSGLDHFVKACDKASLMSGKEVKPTKRQASKFKRGYGLAYAHRND